MASIDHVYQAGAVTLSGNVVAAFQAPPSFADTAVMARGQALIEGIEAAPDTGALLVAIRDLQRMMPSLDTSIVRWTDDTRFVLDRLTARYCVLDARCVAGLDFDGLTYGAATDSVMVRPFFFASSGGTARMHEVFTSGRWGRCMP